MSYLIALKFSENSHASFKIKEFRKRFDTKYENLNQNFLSIVPPFSIEFKNKEERQNFFNNLADVIDDNLTGLESANEIEFNGINFSVGKKGILALSPIISPDIFYTQESISAYLSEENVTYHKKKQSFVPLLVIGRFEGNEFLEAGIEQAKIEFAEAFSMQATALVVYEKKNDTWLEINNLYKF